MKKERVFWGFYFILGAACILLGKMGFLQGISVINIFISILLVALIIKSVLKVNFLGIFLPIAFLAIIYAVPLGITAIVPGPVIIAAVLLSIGCSLIFPKRKQFDFDHKWHDNMEQVINEADGNSIQYSVSFGSAIKYINTDNFEAARLGCSFGAMVAYFDNAIMQNPEATIYLENSFGGMEVYLPKTWSVVNQVNNSFGGVEEKGHNAPDGLHKVYLVGTNSFGGITIYYI